MKELKNFWGLKKAQGKAIDFRILQKGEKPCPSHLTTTIGSWFAHHLVKIKHVLETNIFTTVSSSEILHQLIDSLFHYLVGYVHPRWCRILSINTMKQNELTFFRFGFVFFSFTISHRPPNCSPPFPLKNELQFPGLLRFTPPSTDPT